MGDRSTSEAAWRTAGRCDNGQCVEIGTANELILVRNSADPAGTRISLKSSEWQIFINRVKAGDYDGL